MSVHNNVETRNLFSLVRQGLVRELSEVDDFYVNGLRVRNGNMPGVVSVYDGEYVFGIDDIDIGDPTTPAKIYANPDAVVCPASPVNLNTLQDAADFAGSITDVDDYDFSDNGDAVVSLTGAASSEVTLITSNIVNFGFTTFVPALSVDNLTVIQAWSPNGAALNSNIRLQFGTAETINRVSLHMNDAGHSCVYTIQASADKTTWTTLATGFAPVLAGWNHCDFINSTAYKFYRIVLAGRTLATETTFITEIKVYETDSNFLVSGFTDYDTAHFADADLVDKAFSTDGVAAGSRIGCKLPAAAKVNRLALYMSGAGCTSTFKILGSNDYVTFDELGTGYAPDAADWNYFDFVNHTEYLYYVLELETDATVETEYCTEIGAFYNGKYFDNYGFSGYEPTALIDGAGLTAGINVSNTAADSYLLMTFDAPVMLNELNLTMSDAAFAATLHFDASVNGVDWTTLNDSITPVLAGVNTYVIDPISYDWQYYRLRLVDDNTLVTEPVTINQIVVGTAQYSMYTSADLSGFGNASSVKFVKRATTVADFEAVHDISLSTVDLTGVDFVYFWLKSDVADGATVSVSISQGASDYAAIVDIAIADEWNQYVIDLSAVLDADKNAIDTITVTMTGGSDNKSIVVDGLIGGAFTCTEFVIPDAQIGVDFYAKVLTYTDMPMMAPTGDVFIQVGNGTVWDPPIAATVEQVLTNTAMPYTEYDALNNTGAISKYSTGNIVLFEGCSYVNTYDPLDTIYVRVLHNGASRVVGGLLYEVND